MILKLLRVELIKTRRSLALLMMLACPLMVVVLNTGMWFKQSASQVVTANTWSMFWMGNTAIWCYFMSPLYVALVTSLLNGAEHKNQTWRLMLTLPIQPRQLYLAKMALAGIFVFGANLALFLMVALSILLLAAIGYPIPDAFNVNAIAMIGKLVLCSAPILVIQHWISWRVPNIVFPLAVGVIATMGIMQIGQSSDWVYYPWSYAMMALNGTSEVMQRQALYLAAGLSLLLLIASTYSVGRKGLEFH